MLEKDHEVKERKDWREKAPERTFEARFNRGEEDKAEWVLDRVAQILFVIQLLKIKG